jgi:hypothetical protein
VLPYSDATAYHVLWADVVVVEQAALGGGEATAAPGDGPRAKPGKATKKTAAKPKVVKKAKASAKPKTEARKPKTRSKSAAPKKQASRKKESE